MGWLGDLSFAEPIFLYLLFPLAAISAVWLLVVGIRLVSRPEKTYGSKYPLVGKMKLWGFFLLASVFMVIALARPSLSGGVIKSSRGDIEVVVLLDNSLSMKAEDIKPSRLEVAKREVVNLGPVLKEGDKVGLFTFGKDSHRELRLTKDLGTFFDQVLQAGFPYSLLGDNTVFDTDLATALEHIYQSMDRQDASNAGFSRDRRRYYNPEKRANRIVLVFSDGDDQFLNYRPKTDEEKKTVADERAKYLKKLAKVEAEYRKRGLKIYPVGIGTRSGVSWLSLLKDYKKNGFIGYPEELEKEWIGQVTRLDRTNLSALAKATGAELSGYDWTVENIQGDVKRYLEHVLNANRRPLLEFTEGDDKQPLWQDCLLVAVGFLLIGTASYPFQGFLWKEKF